jgi:RNA polymerase sigma-70 factor (ECF subfamily)
MPSGDERMLVQSILNKDELAVLSFVQQFQDMLYSQCYKMLRNSMDAEEACQDVFMKALRRMKEFEGKSKLSTWLYSIAYHTCLDVLKKRKRQGPEVDIDDTQLPEWTQIESALSGLENEEQRKLIDLAVHELEATDAMIIDLYYLQGIPTKEIMEITNMSDGNIRIRLMRARKKLAYTLSRTLPQETIEQYKYGNQ